MEVSFSDLKEKEIINISNGKKLGHIVDILFDCSSGEVKGVIVPGERKLFKKCDDIFIPLTKLKKIGDDVILVGLTQKAFESSGERVGYQQKNNAWQEVHNENYYHSNHIQKVHNAGYDKFQNNKGQSQSNINNQSYIRYKPIRCSKYK